MIDIEELMRVFGLKETPYVNLGLEWCTDNGSVYFVGDGWSFSAVYDERSLVVKDGIVCMLNDVQQFRGWEPAVFTESLELSVEMFEEKYGDLM